jgi:hypothetical protein
VRTVIVILVQKNSIKLQLSTNSADYLI